jgi:uncharacterized protein (DUF2384 family)
LAEEVGWKYHSVVKTLEKKRRMKNAVREKKRKLKRKLTQTASLKIAKQAKVYNDTIKKLGY